VHYRMCWFCLT